MLSDIEGALLRFLRERCGAGTELNESTDLIQSGLLDSLLLVDLVLEMERRFGVAFSAGDVTPHHFQSVRSLAVLIEHKGSMPARKGA